MTDPEILTLVKKHFEVGGIRDDGSSSEYYGTPDAFLKFARVMYEKGKELGYWEGYENDELTELERLIAEETQND